MFLWANENNLLLLSSITILVVKSCSSQVRRKNIPTCEFLVLMDRTSQEIWLSHTPCKNLWASHKETCQSKPIRPLDRQFASHTRIRYERDRHHKDLRVLRIVQNSFNGKEETWLLGPRPNYMALSLVRWKLLSSIRVSRWFSILFDFV